MVKRRSKDLIKLIISAVKSNDDIRLEKYLDDNSKRLSLNGKKKIRTEKDFKGISDADLKLYLTAIIKTGKRDLGAETELRKRDGIIAESEIVEYSEDSNQVRRFSSSSNHSENAATPSGYLASKENSGSRDITKNSSFSTEIADEGLPNFEKLAEQRPIKMEAETLEAPTPKKVTGNLLKSHDANINAVTQNSKANCQTSMASRSCFTNLIPSKSFMITAAICIVSVVAPLLIKYLQNRQPQQMPDRGF